jgi:O-antigen/teichoic acid export membrane protein
VTPPAADWAPKREQAFATVARNTSARYVALVTDMVIGLGMLPFNLAHLGAGDYGLWVLLGSLTIHFSVFDLGFSGALVKFVAQYRATANARALNEIASTMFFAFAAVGALVYLAVVGVALNLDRLFPLSAAEAGVGASVLMIIGVHIALNFPFSVFGSISSGFQRYDINSAAAIVSSLAVAAVNIWLVLAGYGLVALVAGTTSVRVLAYFVYRRNAYRVYPELRIRPSLARTARLREIAGFSVYTSVIDWANRLNYQLDSIVIGAFLGPAAVAVWAPAERIISSTQRLTNQVNGMLFPLVVDSDAANERARLRQILFEGTRFSLAFVVPIATLLLVLADPLLRAWLGARAELVAGAVPVIQILAVAVAIRVGGATGTTVLKGTGWHRMLAGVNLTTGIVNVALSAWLITRYGLAGVAIGTLLPIAAATILVLYPAACRRVGVPLASAIHHAVWPALWPAIPMGGLLWALRPLLPANLAGVAAGSTAGILLYVLLFAGIAIGRSERVRYFSKVGALLRRDKAAPAAGRARVPGAVAGGR